MKNSFNLAKNPFFFFFPPLTYFLDCFSLFIASFSSASYYSLRASSDASLKLSIKIAKKS